MSDLKIIERKISEQAKKLYFLKSDITKTNANLEVIKSNIKTSNNDIYKKKIQISNAIMAQLYSLNSSHLIKQIIEKGATDQHNNYLYEKVNNSQLQSIISAAELLDKQRLLKSKLNSSLELKKSKEHEYNINIVELREYEAQKSHLLEISRHKLSEEKESLSKLKDDELILSQKLSRLLRSNSYSSKDNFKGSLMLPVSLSPSTFQINYPIIKVQANSPVRAVAKGKVVFADWLKGLGLLIIVDHGNGYMSLYGHNQTLLKEPGQIVNQGEVISLVGNSGGHLEASLFFELRKDGQQISNLNRWFKL